jgi:hypothetical protein
MTETVAGPFSKKGPATFLSPADYGSIPIHEIRTIDVHSFQGCNGAKLRNPRNSEMPATIRCRYITFVLLALSLTGCGRETPPAAGGAPGVTVGGEPDADRVRAADVSVLFVGNSHTASQDLPNLVCKMIQFRHPERTVVAHVVGVGFLDDTVRDPRCREEIESRPWKFVVLQAQRISASGIHEYSRAEGIDLAKRAKARGTAAVFFSEWGLRTVADNGPRHEAIYTEMARAADARVAPVGRAWALALTKRPDLPLYAADGNHEDALGAFLTACVLVGRLTGESPAALAAFPYPNTNEADRKVLADAAAAAIEQYDAGVEYR